MKRKEKKLDGDEEKRRKRAVFYTLYNWRLKPEPLHPNLHVHRHTNAHTNNNILLIWTAFIKLLNGCITHLTLKVIVWTEREGMRSAAVKRCSSLSMCDKKLGKCVCTWNCICSQAYINACLWVRWYNINVPWRSVAPVSHQSKEEWRNSQIRAS